MTQTRTRRSHAVRREEAEARIFSGAIQLIAEKGYNGFTLADVGAASGYSRALPTHYYGRKDDFLVKVANYLVDDYNDLMATLPPSEAGLQRLLSRIRFQYQCLRADPQKYRAMGVLIAEASFQPKLLRAVNEVNARTLKVLREEIRRGIELKNIRSDTDVASLAASILSFTRGQMSMVVLDPNFPIEDSIEEFIAMLRQRLSPSS